MMEVNGLGTYAYLHDYCPAALAYTCYYHYGCPGG